MKLDQLANDHETYGDLAGWWLVVSDDSQHELSEPFPTLSKAMIHLNLLEACRGVLDNWAHGDLAAAVRKLDSALSQSLSCRDKTQEAAP